MNQEFPTVMLGLSYERIRIAKDSLRSLGTYQEGLGTHNRYPWLSLVCLTND